MGYCISVATRLLRLIHGAVSALDHGTTCVARMPGGHTDADGDPARFGEIGLCDPCPQPLGQHASLFQTGLGGQHQEFLAPPAPQLITLAQLTTNRLCKAAQHLVAHIMAMRVIDLLEVVHVEQQQGAGPVMTGRQAELRIDRLFYAIAVPGLGQRISVGQPFQSFVGLQQPRVQFTDLVRGNGHRQVLAQVHGRAPLDATPARTLTADFFQPAFEGTTRQLLQSTLLIRHRKTGRVAAPEALPNFFCPEQQQPAGHTLLDPQLHCQQAGKPLGQPQPRKSTVPQLGRLPGHAARIVLAQPAGHRLQPTQPRHVAHRRDCRQVPIYQRYPAATKQVEPVASMALQQFFRRAQLATGFRQQIATVQHLLQVTRILAGAQQKHALTRHLNQGMNRITHHRREWMGLQAMAGKQTPERAITLNGHRQGCRHAHVLHVGPVLWRYCPQGAARQIQRRFRSRLHGYRRGSNIRNAADGIEVVQAPQRRGHVRRRKVMTKKAVHVLGCRLRDHAAMPVRVELVDHHTVVTGQFASAPDQRIQQLRYGAGLGNPCQPPVHHGQQTPTALPDQWFELDHDPVIGTPGHHEEAAAVTTHRAIGSQRAGKPIEAGHAIAQAPQQRHPQHPPGPHRKRLGASQSQHGFTIGRKVQDAGEIRIQDQQTAERLNGFGDMHRYPLALLAGCGPFDLGMRLQMLYSAPGGGARSLAAQGPPAPSVYARMKA